ncbi:MAG: RagB/SusD family nutrient uptake outer membrane protein [Chitinophagaceae bacterium]|nr:RagB/SusD family nutrient uptake outer membrane protein [Chitinophagaceae bacterium]MCW5926179.1 RagB/SusD family nutrient uptake outer membrane protein [Chitinophagaceae bacterium]
MKLLNKYLLIVVAGAFLSSCEKYLEKEPDNRANLNTPQKISQLLGSAYPQANYVPFIETYSDNVGDNGTFNNDFMGADQVTANADAFFFRDTRSIGEDTPEFYWFACYKAIAAANQALKAISVAHDQEAYRAQRGEAMMTRAYAHFMLVNLFAEFFDPATASTDPGIPYVTEPETNFIKQYSRENVAHVYAMIENDLVTGLGYLDDNNYVIPKYHFTQAAAHAFATRFYLYKKDYEKVIHHATLAVPNNNYLPNLRPWNTEYNVIGLNDVAPRYAKATENANILLAETRSYWFRANIAARYTMTPAIRNQILRDVPVVGGTWAIPTGTYIDNHPVVPKIDEHFVTVSVNADIGDGYVMVPLFTMEEVLFNLAEAYTYTNQYASAIALLNAYLSTRITSYNSSRNLTEAKITGFWGTDLQNGLIQTILAYRRTEFIHEGLRWFDIQRYKLTVTHMTQNGELHTLEPGDPRRVFQIPATASQSGVEQNPR